MSDDYEIEIVDPLGLDYNPEPPEIELTKEEEDSLNMSELDKERYNEDVVAAYRKIMELAEVDPNADSYEPEDEAKDL